MCRIVYCKMSDTILSACGSKAGNVIQSIEKIAANATLCLIVLFNVIQAIHSTVFQRLTIQS